MRFHVPEPRLAERELERARHYDWPGNVRELQNTIERAVILAQGGPLKLDLPQAQSQPAAIAARETQDVIPEQEWRQRERANILTALEKSGYRVSGKGGAAELLGVNAATLTSRLKVLGIAKTRREPAYSTRSTS